MYKRNKSNIGNKQKNTNINATDFRKPHMSQHYKSKRLEQHIKLNIEGITPSKIPEDISTLFLEKIWNTINSNIQKDINELFTVYYYQQWTATSLMAMRILENVLNIHISYDLKEDNIKNIGEAIQKLKKHNYPSKILELLKTYQEKRNAFMHGNTRAGSRDAKIFVIDVISITMYIHNIP